MEPFRKTASGLTVPRPLKPGDTVRMIGISGTVRAEDVRAEVAACAAKIEGLGFRVQIDDSCCRRWGYLCGTDEERADAVNRAFADDSVDGIWCIRGGYGCIRMLDLIDWDMIRSHPKTFVGYSDITTMHIALQEKCGLCTFHGPMGLSKLTDEHTRSSVIHAVTGAPDRFLENFSMPPMKALRGGTAEGVLTGGNLTLVTASVGTRYAVDPRGKLLFLEDIGERTYVLDRYLHQLYTAGVLSECAGIILGAFTDCVVEHPEAGLTLDEILEDLVRRLKVPVLSGLQCGHISDTLTLPLGRRYRMDADHGTLERID